MKIVVVKNKFQKSLANALRLVPSRPQLPILSKVLISANNKNQAVIRATDLEMGGEFIIGCKTESGGGVVVDGRLVNDAVKGMTGDKVVLKTQGGKLIISSDGQTVSVTTEGADDFPPFPKVKTGEHQVKIKRGILEQVADRTLFSVSKDEIRPVLTGIRLAPTEGGRVEVASTDGVRLSIYKTEWGKLEKPIIIPARFIREAAQINSEELNIGTLSDGKQIFAGGVEQADGERLLISQLIEGDYPKYQTIIPNDLEVKVVVNRELLKQRLSLVMVMAKEGGGVIKITSPPSGPVKLISKTSAFGGAEAKVDAEVDGGGVEVALNGRFLLEAIEAVRSEFVTLGLNNNLKPIVIRGVEDDDYLHILMPVNLQE